MSSCFQAINLPIGGTVNQLDNVTVSAKYPASNGKTGTGKRSRNITVTDSSGTVKVSLWGQAADLPIMDGQVYTIRGNLKRGEYPAGIPQMSGENGISVIPADGTPAAQSPAQQAQSAAGPSQGPKTALTDKQLSTRMAEFTISYLNALTSAGAGKEFAEKAAVYAPQFCAQWFHGEKYPVQDPSDEVPVKKDAY